MATVPFYKSLEEDPDTKPSKTFYIGLPLLVGEFLDAITKQ